MTFQQLQYLLEVSRTGSISGAAKNLFLAQSSISASISNLEDELGFPVFIRSKKGVIPTVQGAEVIEQASRICESYRVMSEAGHSGKRRVRISAPGIELLDEVFAELVAYYAEDRSLILSADALSTVDVARKLASFELDVAVVLNHEARFLSVETLLESKNLQWEIIGTLPVVIQIGPGHPLYEKASVEISDLQDSLFVDNTHDPLLQNEFLKGIIRLTPENTVSVKSSHARNLLVARGLGYTIGVGAPKAISQALHFRSLPLKDICYTMTVVTNPQRQLSREAETYIHLIKKQFANRTKEQSYESNQES